MRSLFTRLKKNIFLFREYPLPKKLLLKYLKKKKKGPILTNFLLEVYNLTLAILLNSKLSCKIASFHQ